jgi:hypothetical protein
MSERQSCFCSIGFRSSGMPEVWCPLDHLYRTTKAFQMADEVAERRGGSPY